MNWNRQAVTLWNQPQFSSSEKKKDMMIETCNIMEELTWFCDLSPASARSDTELRRARPSTVPLKLRTHFRNQLHLSS